ncbi:MAG: hypothetical protein MUF69_04405, partial [Desulfobacterota bacterium]|nr:hypothetical protein [Thermodesulfobacteriota bacterium]
MSQCKRKFSIDSAIFFGSSPNKPRPTTSAALYTTFESRYATTSVISSLKYGTNSGAAVKNTRSSGS